MRNEVVVATVIVLMAVSGVAGYFTGSANTRPNTMTTTATTTKTTIITGVSSTIIYGMFAIELGVSGNESIKVGKNETVAVSFTNQSPYTLNATYEGFAVASYGPPFSGNTWANYVLPVPIPCGNYPSGYVPYYVAIYNQSGRPLQLNAVPPSFVMCISTLNGNRHVFGPSQVVTESISIGGFWRSSDANQPWVNATFARFSPGAYAIVVFDPWNHLTGMTFAVTA